VVNVGDKIEVKVIDIDTVRRRISLSLKQAQAPTAAAVEQDPYEAGPAVETAYSSGGDDEAPAGGTLAAAFAQAGLTRDASPTPEEMALAEAELPEEPAAEEPAAEEPAADEPAAGEPAADEPAADDEAEGEGDTEATDEDA
jgi:small subunit ribosomal protein S1